MPTPMFEQYHALKASNPDAILFFRMGDFFEMFFDDAKVASEHLDLALTSRNRNDPVPVPMAGFPHHHVAGYVQRLVDAGHRVAIADQVEDPSKAKGLVERKVVRVVTPGVVFDPTTLDGHTANWLAAVLRDPSEGVGLAFLDVSTGAFRCTTVSQWRHACAELDRFAPREILVQTPADLAALRQAACRALPTCGDEDLWHEDTVADEFPRCGLSLPSANGLQWRCAAAALRYARTQSGGVLAHIHHIDAYVPSTYMVVDETSRRGLELHRTLLGNTRKGSLTHLIDRSSTAMGSRMLEDWVRLPLLDVSRIERRQAAVAMLHEHASLRTALRGALKNVADIERLVARVGSGHASPRDLAALRASLQAMPAVATLLAEKRIGLDDLSLDDVCADACDDLTRWLVDDPPIAITEGGIVQPCAHPPLAELVRLSVDGLSVLAQLEERERVQTGISSLKIRNNKVFGYFIEVTAANLHRVPEHYLRKQTLSNAERYITPELKELEERLLNADAQRRELEHQLFLDLRDRVAEFAGRLQRLARRIATIDALAALAEVAARYSWCRPSVTSADGLSVTAARHPVVEANLDEARFVPNDIQLGGDGPSLVVLTGPNMSGKSTVLRQTAVIALLAQMGSFVPAEAAELGLVDRIFTRVGAADDLRHGRSTFLVEMSETASILEHATARSLVVLDEIGRGTSTYDGLAIAWAVAEDLVDRIGCRALFATHYHELCGLADTREAVANFSVAVSEHQGQILFLRRLKPGGANRSYGIQCAQLAGLPAPVVDRAKGLLQRFEKTAPIEERKQLALFGVTNAQPSHVDVADDPAPAHALIDAVRGIDPDALSPREALDALYTLRALAEDS